MLSANIKKLRESKGWSQAKLAVEAGVYQVGISEIERGISNPRLQTLQAIAKALGVSVSELMED